MTHEKINAYFPNSWIFKISDVSSNIFGMNDVLEK